MVLGAEGLMTYAPVVVFERRKLVAARLLQMGVPIDRIVAAAEQPGSEALDTLWGREKVIAGLTRLTGHGRGMLDMLPTADLHELERRTLASLMGADGRTPDQLIYSISGRRPKTRAGRRAQQNRAWNLSA